MNERTELAQSLRRHLRTLGHDVGQGHMLTVLARTAGYADDNALKAAQGAGTVGAMRLDVSARPAAQSVARPEPDAAASAVPRVPGKLPLLFPPVGTWSFPPPAAEALLRTHTLDHERALWTASRERAAALMARAPQPRGEAEEVMHAAVGTLIWLLLLTAMSGRDPTVLALLSWRERGGGFLGRVLAGTEELTPTSEFTPAGRLLSALRWSVSHRKLNDSVLENRVWALLSGSDPVTHGDLDAFLASLPAGRLASVTAPEQAD